MSSVWLLAVESFPKSNCYNLQSSYDREKAERTLDMQRIRVELLYGTLVRVVDLSRELANFVT